MTKALRSRLRSGLIGLVVLAMPCPCLAHPHVRISVAVSFEVRSGTLTAIREKWTFDEAFKKSTIEQHDKNGNGKLDADELKQFMRLSAATMKRFSNFTTVGDGKTIASLAEAVFARVDMDTTRPVIEFNVALLKPLTLGKSLMIEIYDPTYFSAFEIAGPEAISVDSDGTSTCSVNLTAPAQDGQQLKDHRAFAVAFGPMAARLVTPRTITLSCLPA